MVTTVVIPPDTSEKHSCYICKELLVSFQATCDLTDVIDFSKKKKYFFYSYTPSEMIAHVKSHGIDTVPKQDAMKDYEACKQCNKA